MTILHEVVMLRPGTCCEVHIWHYRKNAVPVMQSTTRLDWTPLELPFNWTHAWPDMAFTHHLCTYFSPFILTSPELVSSPYILWPTHFPPQSSLPHTGSGWGMHFTYLFLHYLLTVLAWAHTALYLVCVRSQYGTYDVKQSEQTYQRWKIV